MPHTESIGRYRVVGTLGQGAMGRVYLADDPGLGIKVAIKFIKRDNMLENEVILARFRREAALGARIRHPNIVAIYDVGQDQVHGPYMVMEYVDGRELIEILREGTASNASKLDWLNQISGALRCAHEAGIVHRDVKPANILVGRDGQAKLIDFGVAKVVGRTFRPPSALGENGASGNGAEEADLLEEKHAAAWGRLSAERASASDEPHLEVISTHGFPQGGDPLTEEPGPSHSDGLTQMGALIGTPSYTAPELLRGDPPTPQTDDFAFAVTAFQCLLGHLPFRGRGTRDTLENIRDGVIEFLGDADPKVRRVFVKALSPDPRNRYPGLPELMEDLYAAYGLRRTEPAPSRIAAPNSRSGSRGNLPALGARTWLGLPLPKLAKWAGLGLLLLVALGLTVKSWLAFPGGLDEITVHTDPSGASVYVDGNYLGQSPLDKVSLEEPGRRLRIVKKHYRSVERSLGADDAFVSLVLDLAPYDLRVETEPPGADMLLDGKPSGSSPSVLRHISAKGAHTLELRMTGYFPKRIQLDPLHPPRGPIVLDPENPPVP